MEIAMDPPATAATARLLKAVPEFEDQFLALVEMFDTDLGDHTVFAEFADFVSEVVESTRSPRPSNPSMALLMRCLALIEDLASSGSASDAELVGIGFLDSLDPGEVEVMSDWLGPATLAIWEDLESGDFVL